MAPDLDSLPAFLGPDTSEPHITPRTIVDLVGDSRRLPRIGFRPDDADLVKDHVAFWNERTDIRVAGELQRRPVTPWSSSA